MTEPKLKPCPFCGGEADFISKPVATIKLETYMTYRVRCRECYAQSPYRSNAYLHGFHRTLDEAAEAWNRRADG